MRLFDLSRAPQQAAPPRQDRIALTHAQRRRHRQMLTLPDGECVGLITPRDHVLQDGERWYCAQGDALQIEAACEPLLRASSNDPHTLCRAAWHLGNRHTAVEIQPVCLQIQPDPVLHDLLLALGLRVEAVNAVFEPESGAYAGGHRHGHDETFAEDHALARGLFQQHHGDA
ncbi:urease accessory protein UreE [Amphibiibacter pelophylacis]|uniref:Urease accessory protein UreE n=1 Tax=Amphibiibacter pelophylacis TaxID=1799477 RepID=A0ACC6P1D7_9BURK